MLVVLKDERTVEICVSAFAIDDQLHKPASTLMMSEIFITTLRTLSLVDCLEIMASPRINKLKSKDLRCGVERCVVLISHVF